MDEISLDYPGADCEIRDDLRTAHAMILEHFRRPGCWFSGEERLAIVAEARLATGCDSCRERRAALSPEHAQAEHRTHGELPAERVDLIHRLRTDSGRLSRRWFDAVRAAGVSEGQ